MRRRRKRLHQPSNCSGRGCISLLGTRKRRRRRRRRRRRIRMRRRIRRRLYQPSNCSGAVSACHLFWPGLHQPVGNKKQDEYEDEEEVEEVEEERDEHEDEYEDERVKTMATIMTTMAIVFGCVFRRTLLSVPIRMHDTDTALTPQYQRTARSAVSTPINPAAERLYQR